MNRRDAENAENAENAERGRDEVDPALNLITEQIISAAIEVHRVLGPGFHEALYEEALCRELTTRGIPHARQQAITVSYKGGIRRVVRTPT